MLKRIMVGCLVGLIGYLLGLGAGIWLVSTLSTNTHDRSVEAAMTGAFVVGPLFALIGFGLGIAYSGHKREGDSEPRP
ncbi:MAG: hypothetical protein HUU16_13005 [Candidatus Omnitrophica bacterium]|nr:hypothetical protein [bacterium]NUN97085.1 hypothetical protein [Candidatus Omnitrophota bacterium]